MEDTRSTWLRPTRRLYHAERDIAGTGGATRRDRYRPGPIAGSKPYRAHAAGSGRETASVSASARNGPGRRPRIYGEIDLLADADSGPGPVRR